MLYTKIIAVIVVMFGLYLAWDQPDIGQWLHDVFQNPGL